MRSTLVKDHIQAKTSSYCNVACLVAFLFYKRIHCKKGNLSMLKYDSFHSTEFSVDVDYQCHLLIYNMACAVLLTFMFTV